MIHITEYIAPELLIIIPVLYMLGIMLKNAAIVPDHRIPVLLGLCSVALAMLYVLSTTELKSWQDSLTAAFTAIVQGILCAGTSVYTNQLFKQEQKGVDKNG